MRLIDTTSLRLNAKVSHAPYFIIILRNACSFKKIYILKLILFNIIIQYNATIAIWEWEETRQLYLLVRGTEKGSFIITIIIISYCNYTIHLCINVVSVSDFLNMWLLLKYAQHQCIIREVDAMSMWVWSFDDVSCLFKCWYFLSCMIMRVFVR